MKTTHLQSARTALAIAVLAMLTACASTPANNPELDNARTAYQRASADAVVVRSAPVELQQAQQSLQKAESALRSGDDPSNVTHYAYLARQRTEVAVQAGKIARADQAVADSSAKRDRILIDARTRDAEQQRSAADKARIEAEVARNEAEAARKLAEDRLAAAEAARKQATQTQSRADSLEAQLAELKALKTERGMVLTLGDVLFDSGQATLKAGALRTIAQLAVFLEKNPTRKVLIEGHTDSVGGEEFNRDLSLRRADAVRQALTEQRIARERIDASGLGERYPVASNDSAAGRQQNRRVELIFSDVNGSIKSRAN